MAYRRRMKRVESVTMEQARKRVLAYLTKDPYDLKGAAMIAEYIWPGNTMRAQGAGLAAVRILKKMEKEGLVQYTCLELGQFRSWGWHKL
jgi:hypothetical protein